MSKQLLPLVLSTGLVAMLALTSCAITPPTAPAATCDPTTSSSADQRSSNRNIVPVPNAPIFPEPTVAEDKGLVLAGCPDGICTWDASSGKITSRASRHGVLSPDLSQTAQAGSAGKIDLMRFDTGDKLLTLAGHPQEEATDQMSNITALVFSPDGQTLASAASTDCTVKLWNTKTGELKDAISTHTGTVTDLAFSADGSRLAISGRDVSAQVWDLPSQNRISIAPKSSTAFGGLAFSAASDQVVLIESGARTKINIYDANTFDLKYSAVADGSAYSPIFDPTGKTLAYSRYDQGLVVLWQPESSKRISLRVPHTAALAFSLDGRTLYTASSYSAIQAERLSSWNSTGKLLRTWETP